MGTPDYGWGCRDVFPSFLDVTVCCFGVLRRVIVFIVVFYWFSFNWNIQKLGKIGVSMKFYHFSNAFTANVAMINSMQKKKILCNPVMTFIIMTYSLHTCLRGRLREHCATLRVNWKNFKCKTFVWHLNWTFLHMLMCIVSKECAVFDTSPSNLHNTVENM